MMADILKFTHTPIIDEIIEEYQCHEYDHITGTNLNNGGDIRITIDSQDVFRHLSETYLTFEGRLTKADGTAYANADEIALTSNAIMHLFSRIEYHLSNQLIESINYPGQATTMLGLLKYPDDFSKTQGLNKLWYKDTATTAAKADNNGFAARYAYLIQSPTCTAYANALTNNAIMHLFSRIEYQLSNLLIKSLSYSGQAPIVFGLLKYPDDFSKAQDLNQLWYKDTATTAVSPAKIAWFMPHAIPADADKFSIYKTIKSKDEL